MDRRHCIRLIPAWLAITAVQGAPGGAQPIPVTASELPTYDISVAYQPGSGHFGVDGAITVPAARVTGGTVELSLAEAAGEPTFVLIEGGRSSGLSASKVFRPMAGRPGWGTNTWRLRATRPLDPKGAVRIGFRYAMAGEVTAFGFHAGAPVAYGAGILTAWYPQLEREPVGADGGLRGLRGTGRISFAVPSDLTVYASGRGVAESPGRYDFQVETPVFLSFAAGRYEVTRRPGRTPAAAFQLRRRDTAQHLLSRSQALVELLSNEFFPYPHDEFAVVEIPTELAGRSGFSGASLEGFIFSTTEFLDKPFNTAFFGHEVGHNWWPYLLGPRGDKGAYLLSDGMVQYGSLRAAKVFEGARAAERYRRTGYPGYYAEYSGFGYLLLAAAGMDRPLSQTDSSRLARTLAESKGMIVWEMLAREVGPERFRRALRGIFSENLYQRIDFARFEPMFSRQVGRDMSWFFEQWFDRVGAPELDITWRRVGGGVVGRIRQRGEAYRLTVPVEIVLGDGSRERHSVPVTAAETRFSLPARGHVAAVELDPAYEVLRWTADYRAEAEGLASHTVAVNAFLAGDNDEAIGLYRAAIARGGRPDRFGLSFMLHYGLAEALLEKREYASARAALEQALASRPLRPGSLPFAHLVRARIAQREGDRAAFDRAAAAVRASDRAVGGITGAPDQLPSFDAPVPR